MAAAFGKIGAQILKTGGAANMTEVFADGVVDSVTDGDILKASGNFLDKAADKLSDIGGPLFDGDGRPFRTNPDQDENIFNNDKGTFLGGIADGDGNPFKKVDREPPQKKPRPPPKQQQNQGVHKPEGSGCGCGCSNEKKNDPCQCEKPKTCETLSCEEKAKLDNLCSKYKTPTKKKTYYKKKASSSDSCFKLTATQKKALQALLDKAP